MRTYTATAAAFAAMTILALAADTRAQQGPFVWGIVKWEQSTDLHEPAGPIRLLRGAR